MQPLGAGAGAPGDRPEPVCEPVAEGLDQPRRDGPCNCLPAAPDGWTSCAHCGLAQAPGKDFCGFCGNRWVANAPR